MLGTRAFLDAFSTTEYWQIKRERLLAWICHGAVMGWISMFWSWFTWRSCFVTPPRLQSLDEVWVHGVTLVHLRRLRSLDEDRVQGVTLLGTGVTRVWWPESCRSVPSTPARSLLLAGNEARVYSAIRCICCGLGGASAQYGGQGRARELSEECTLCSRLCQVAGRARW